MNQPEKKDLPNVLKIPEGVAPTGPVMDITEAYVKAIIALPECLKVIYGELVGISDSMAILALYAERKGIDEGVIKPDELTADDDGKQTA